MTIVNYAYYYSRHPSLKFLTSSLSEKTTSTITKHKNGLKLETYLDQVIDNSKWNWNNKFNEANQTIVIRLPPLVTEFEVHFA